MTVWFGLLTVEEVLAFLDERPTHVEVILTGRRAPQELIERADLVTEMREVKHYYQQGVAARKGIGYRYSWLPTRNFDEFTPVTSISCANFFPR